MILASHSAIDSDQRQEPRSPAELKAVVQVKDEEQGAWKEFTKVATVSRNGAGFSLTRPCTVGRLVTVVLPMPTELRAYDENAELYPVMAIVQYCNEGVVDNEKAYHVGVGFIGKQVPASFKEDPTQNYRITGMSPNGLWEITETDSEFKNRQKPRHWVSIPVTISLIQREEKAILKEETFTKNVGAGGVSVTSNLDARVGDKVKFACPQLNFYAIAVVRNRKASKKESPTLHLEFVDSQFPVEKLANKLSIVHSV